MRDGAEADAEASAPLARDRLSREREVAFPELVKVGVGCEGATLAGRRKFAVGLGTDLLGTARLLVSHPLTGSLWLCFSEKRTRRRPGLADDLSSPEDGE